MIIYKLLMRLYPHSWRARYEEEFMAVLASRPYSLWEGLDLIRGALDAHLHPYLGTTSMEWSERIKLMLATLRHSLLLLFCSFCIFCTAGIAFQKLTEYHDFTEAAASHSLIGLSFNLVVIGSVIAALAVLIGGLPLVATVLKDALVHRRYGLLSLLLTPLLALGIFIGTTLLIEALIPTGTSTFLTLLSRGIFLCVFFGTIIVSAGAICLAIERSTIPARLLRFAVLPSLLLTLSMLVMLIATLLWGLNLRSGVPQLFNSNEGLFGTSTAAGWIRIVLVMAFATVLAFFSLIRSFSARSVLPDARI